MHQGVATPGVIWGTFIVILLLDNFLVMYLFLCEVFEMTIQQYLEVPGSRLNCLSGTQVTWLNLFI